MDFYLKYLGLFSFEPIFSPLIVPTSITHWLTSSCLHILSDTFIFFTTNIITWVCALQAHWADTFPTAWATFLQHTLSYLIISTLVLRVLQRRWQLKNRALKWAYNIIITAPEHWFNNIKLQKYYLIGLGSITKNTFFFFLIVAAIGIIEMLNLELQRQMMCVTCTFRNLSTGK